ncbi:hypothetical protein OEZ85_000388 [Tetradesmus obliquus]|uniref:adenylate kinase n=1 Tax=Tetradesmus obliquus TaxID=3088 RepID=A0ABY8UR37_TETOB|nr:hypothetical protein OEZ85_000388 [Tetradesmus obliquus]
MGNALGCRPQRQDNGRVDEQQKARKELRDKGSPDVAAAAQEALPDNVRIVFVLGGPGSGKGTQCERIVAKYGHTHLSAGDLLRDEVKSGSELGKQCEAIMKEGKLVPMEVIIGLLRAAMVRSGGSSFLIDGFPRALDQAEMFERMVKPAELVLAFDCPEEVMEARLLKRGETSGRSDDNTATIRKRFETFVSQSLPVIAHYEQLGKCHRISAVPPPEEVFEAVQAAIERSEAEAKLLEAASVVFVLGGPGSGKGTQCERIVAKYGHTHLSAGDLLRDEVKSGSELGKQCEAIMKEGKLVPMEVIIGLLRAAMVRGGGSSFLIDGFPRALDQAEMFERMVKPAELVLAFDCPEEVMEARLLKRGETSGRSDDNAATIRKRFETFVSQSMPVIAHYEQLGKCHRISAIPAPDKVFEAVQAVVEGKAVATLAPPPDEDVQMVVPLAQGELHPEALVVFVLGGPGSGKGTQCERIVAKYGHTHLSAGDLLRDEVKSGSQVGKQCETIMKEGKLVPMEVTIALLRNAMVRSGAKDFLIDGFPRAMDQALAFEQMIKPCRMVLAFDCREEVMEARLLKRGETSGRSDDNAATIRKRFETFVSQSLPVISHYEQLGKCHRISAVPPPEQVFAMVCHVLEPTARASLTITSSGQLQQKQGLEVEPAAEVPAPALAFA